MYGVDSSTDSSLIVSADSDLDFVLAGTWDTVSQTGSGTWTIDSGSSVSVATLNLTSGTTVFNVDSASSDAIITVSGTATVSNTVEVNVGANALGSDITLISAGTLDTSSATLSLVSSNPNFSVSRVGTDASGNLTISASFTPKYDEGSLALSSSLAAVQGFSTLAQGRAMTLLADASSNSNRKKVLLAAAGSLDGLVAKPQDKDWSYFVEPVMSKASRNSLGNQAGYDSTLMGIEMGLDKYITKNFVLGAMLGVGKVNIDFKGSSFVDDDTEDQDLYTVGVYAGYGLGALSFTDALTWTYADHDGQRNAGSSEVATSDYGSYLIDNQLLAQYSWKPLQHWTFIPKAGINTYYLHRNCFTEEGSSNDVSYDDLDKLFGDAVAGVRAEYEFTLDAGATLTPYAGVGYKRSLGNNNLTVTQYLSSASADVTTTNDDNRTTAEAGLTLKSGAVSFTLGYTGEYGCTSKVHTGFGLLKYRF